MSSLNRVILLGNLGKDPEVRYTQGGTTVANLRIATNERRPDGNGGWKDETEWHAVVLFGKQAQVQIASERIAGLCADPLIVGR